MQKYTVTGIRNFLGIKHIVTEDKASGFEFFQEHFNIDIASANSKSEIIRYLQKMVEKDTFEPDIRINEAMGRMEVF